MVLLHRVLDMAWLLFLLLMLRHFWRDRQYLLKSQQWSVIDGRITKLEWTQYGHSFWPKIEYTYQVNEEEFTGEYLLLDTSHNTPHSRYARKIAYRAAMAYDKNEKIEIFFNPEDPRQSALDVSMPKKLNVIIGLLVALIILHLAIVGYRLLHF